MTEAQRAELIEARRIFNKEAGWGDGFDRLSAEAEVDWFLAHLPAPALPADVGAQIEALKARYAAHYYLGPVMPDTVECIAGEAIDRTAAIFRPLVQAEK